MSLENAVYEFIQAQVDASSPNSAISNSLVHADTYEEILKGSKWIRVDDVMRSEPSVLPNNTSIREFNAFLEVQCVVKPNSQSLIDRREARYSATAMANALTLLIFNNQNLNDTNGFICDCVVKQKRNEWRKVGQVKHAVSFLLLQINL